MSELQISAIEKPSTGILFTGGIFLDDSLPSSIIRTLDSDEPYSFILKFRKPLFKFSGVRGGGFLSTTLSVTKNHVSIENSSINERLSSTGDNASSGETGVGSIKFTVVEGIENEKRKGNRRSRAAVNAVNHLLSGIVAAIVTKTFVAPLERLKLEYMVRGSDKKLFELIMAIATTQGLKGFWKGNFVNILRTSPFKAVNFYANDTYKKQLVKLCRDEETKQYVEFISGAAAGVTATVLCLPLDTIRTKMAALGGDALGGVIGTVQHVIKTEGVFSLYNGLVPSILSLAPSSGLYYGIYGRLKSAYLSSPEGRKRVEKRKQSNQELNALDKMELGTIRTLVNGAIAGVISDFASHPLEVVKRQLQLQGGRDKVNALTMCVKIVEKGGIPALYVGLLPSLLQVIPSSAISYFVYEYMRAILKVE